MKTQYIVTERAHYMCPNMHFGMVLEVAKAYDEEQVCKTLNRMADAHPFLKSLIAQEKETDRIYYRVMDCSQINLNIRENEATLWEDYSQVAVCHWNIYEEGLMKVYIYPQSGGMKVLFVVHHLLVDGRGALELAEEFGNDYVADIEPSYVEEQLMETMEDLPPHSSLSAISKLLVRQANAQWKKEANTVSYEQYSKFAVEYARNHPVAYQTYHIDKKEMEEIGHLCWENAITVNDFLMAQMYAKTKAKNIIIASDIRNVFSRYRKGALGNYATAMGIKCPSRTTNVIELAKKVHKAVERHTAKNSARMQVLACYFELTPTLLDAAAISALGGWQSKAGSFVGESMFHMGTPTAYSITNLGKVENDNLKSLMFIPPASPAAKLTLGVVTLNGKLSACASNRKIT